VRSRSNARVIAILLTAALISGPLGAQEPTRAPPPATGPVKPDEIVRVLAKLEADPNIAPTKQVRMLQWESDPKEKKRSGFWSWLRPVGKFFAWIGELFGWLAASSRLLVWILAAVLIGFLAVFILRLIRSGALGAGGGKFTAPSFVRDLDIRPESLPPDIGAAAFALWEQGEKRGALALLYRGMLSRLVHVHSVPIRDSSTEGDCLALATRHLRAERVAYVSTLIRTWQSAVYGGIEAETDTVRALCAEFSAALDAADAPELQQAGQPA
jgi:hypothetical protein